MATLRCAGLIALIPGAMFGQTDKALQFEIADVHPSAKAPNASLRNVPPRNGRYELRNATMLDLIRIAYGLDADRILEGPNWLELDRFDVVAKIPADAEPGAQKAMLQSLLEERFKLVVHKDTKPLATWALLAGKQPRLKEANGASPGESGCKLQAAAGPPSEGGARLVTGNPDGTRTAINLGPGGTIQYTCRNMTMAKFAEGLRGMMGAQLAPEPVADETGLKGLWNFEVRWSIGILAVLRQGEQISVAEAIEKQLGLKLEQRQIAKPVLVVDSVNRTPTPDPPGVAEALASPPDPKEFEVADVKLSAAGSGLPEGGMIRMQMLPGGRFVCQNFPLRLLISQAFNSRTNSELFVGLPSWADSVRVDITAKTSPDAVVGPGINLETLGPMLVSLLAERFKMTYHREERQVTAYSLVAAKPKMKKADPNSRIFCRRGQAPAGSPPGSQLLTCQNATMAFFAEQLLQVNPGLNWPVVDATELEGGWDFTMTFGGLPPALLNGLAKRADGDGPDAAPTASDPGGAYTIFEVIEKQLGLKLKAEKRMEQVIVIDHLEQKPTDN
jgi:uncharacterized protein (TIGR03435 family)